MLNYLAAPCGSEEDLLLRYGYQDVDYRFDDKGNPVPTDAGRANVLPWRNLAAPAPILYVPVSSEFPTILQPNEKALLAVGVEDASVGLYSKTYASKGATANRDIGDGLTDIVAGRRPMSDYDNIVKTWLSAVGTDSKKEYAQAYAAAKNA